MDLKQFILNGRTGAYKDNPEIAEEMYKMSPELISKALGDRKIKDMTTDMFTKALVEH